MPGHSARSCSSSVGSGVRRLPGEWDDEEAPPDRVVEVGDRRGVVAEHRELELRPELEAVLPHEPSADRLAAGQRFHARLGPALARLGFGSRDHPGSSQGSEFLRVALVRRGGEGVERRDPRVLAHNAADDVGEHRLPVTARSMEEGERLLLRRAGEVVARPLREEPHQVLVTAGRLLKEENPPRAVGECGRRHRCALRDEVTGLGRSDRSRPQIDRPAGRAEGEQVLIPIVSDDGDALVPAGQFLDTSGRTQRGPPERRVPVVSSSASSRARSRVQA